MIVYLATPKSQQLAQHVAGMPVLLSYAMYSPWMDRGYQQSFSNILIDSGAFSEFNSGVKIDLVKYTEWSLKWESHADAIAGLDDISGDWRKSLKNYEKFPLGFPTYHESDPYDFLDEIIDISQERKQWLGLGLIPPRKGKWKWVKECCDRIPSGIHIHCWAGREFTHIRRLDSVDSTNWWRDAMKLRTIHDLKHLNYGECLEIIVKRYQRWNRSIFDKTEPGGFFDGS